MRGAVVWAGWLGAYFAAFVGGFVVAGTVLGLLVKAGTYLAHLFTRGHGIAAIEAQRIGETGFLGPAAFCGAVVFLLFCAICTISEDWPHRR